MAFGAGALLFASLVDLFGEALNEIKHYGRTHIFIMAGTAVLGCALFETLNSLLEQRASKGNPTPLLNGSNHTTSPLTANEYIQGDEHIDGEVCAISARSSALDSETLDSVKSGYQAAQSIWLGILIDGVPESIVIGALVVSSREPAVRDY
jgi:zinc transporter ZupT